MDSMNSYEKAMYLFISSAVGIFMLFIICLTYWSHQEKMFELELKYKSLERNETIKYDEMPKV